MCTRGGIYKANCLRTCLKEVPNNLIFHLKRFEFDLNDLSRRKINDYFEFPMSLDINAYHVDQLSNPNVQIPEDIFDLVGVLVHAGTCENGHYYSYIRQRPDLVGSSKPSWVEFDDSNVVPFDPEDIPSKAFGGLAEEGGYSRSQLKPYSAYMLFYERRTSIENAQHVQIEGVKGEPFKVAAPTILHQEVMEANRIFIEEYTRFDPNHTKFVRQLHNACRTVNQGTCSEDHDQEDRVLHVVLAHLGQIVWRQPSPEMFVEIVNQLRRTVLSCFKCCNAVLNTLAADEYPLLDPLVRCSHNRVRSCLRTFIMDCLKSVREMEPAIYGLDRIETSVQTDGPEIADGILAAVITKLRKTADKTWISTRGWDDFYLLLHQILELGAFEVATLLNCGFLRFCTRLFVLPMLHNLEGEEQELSRIMQGKRMGVFNRLIDFLSTLVSRTNVRLTPIASDYGDRMSQIDEEEMRFPLTMEEIDILFSWDRQFNALAVLDRTLEFFDHTKTAHFAPGVIVKCMLETDDISLQTKIYNTIVEGVGLEPPFCNAYMIAALSYCEATPMVEYIPRVITAVSKAIVAWTRDDDDRTPSEHAIHEFFFGILGAENGVLFERKHSYMFKQYLMQKARIYAVPLLLHPNERVRRGTQTFLTRLYKDCDDAPPDTMFCRWKSIRELLPELQSRIIYEKDAGMLRSHLSCLVGVCQSLLNLLWSLGHDDDPELERYKDDNDKTLFYQWSTEVEARMRAWPPDLDSPLSSAEQFEPSEYGSESDGGGPEAFEV